MQLFRVTVGMFALAGGPIFSGCIARNESNAASTSTATTADTRTVTSQADSAPPDTGRLMNVLTSTTEVQLGASPTRVALPGIDGPALLHRAQAASGRHRLLLVIRDVRAEVPPGVLYHLYLDLPAGKTAAPRDAHHVGSLNFYDANRAAGAGLLHSFDITDVVMRLAAARMLTSETTLTIASDGPVSEGTRPVIGRMEIIEQ